MSDPYWKQFMHTVEWDRIPTVEGILEGRGQEGRREDPYPVLIVRTESGHKLKINASQVRLKNELMRLKPQIGDRITITYKGEAETSAPGMNPAKEFEVVVVPKLSQSQGSATGVRGSASASGAGK